jgi:hypothetical protein
MYRPKRAEDGETRISAAAQTAPGGGLAGMMETEEMVEEMVLGAVGMARTDRADPRSCRVYSRLSEESDGQDRTKGEL